MYNQRTVGFFWGAGSSYENHRFLKAFERAGTSNSLILELSRNPKTGNCWIFLKELEITDGSLILDLLQITYYNRRFVIRDCFSSKNRRWPVVLWFWIFFLQRTEDDRWFCDSGFFFFKEPNITGGSMILDFLQRTEYNPGVPCFWNFLQRTEYNRRFLGSRNFPQRTRTGWQFFDSGSRFKEPDLIPDSFRRTWGNRRLFEIQRTAQRWVSSSCCFSSSRLKKKKRRERLSCGNENG